MDCHLNCHGELNMLLATLPFVGAAFGWLRARFRRLRAAPVKS